MERRKHSRIPQRLCLTIDQLPGRNITFTGNISADGICIGADAPLTIDSAVSITLALPTGRDIRLNGQVRWVTRNAVVKSGVNRYGIGILLNDPPEEFQQFVRSLSAIQQPPTPPPVASPAPVETNAQSSSKSDGELPDPQPIMVAYEAMKQQSHYELLGVETKATQVQIKQAYYTLSKRYHPDGPLGECSKELKHNLEELFHRVTEAYVTLSSDEQRKRYDRTLVKQRAEVSQTALTKRFRSGQHVQEGLRRLEEGNFEAAAASFELASQARPDKWKYHTLLAYSLSKLPGREQDAEAHYRQAIVLEPSRAENYIGLGRLYQRVGQDSDALRAFEDALQWDAENTRIIKEIDAIKKVA
jgi:curved DNA-binding protein CbpA